MAAAPLLGRAIIPHLRLHLHLHLHLNTTLPAAVCFLIRRPCYTTTASESPRPIRKVPSTTTYDDKASLLSTKRHPPKDSRWENDPDYRKWKDKEAEILLEVDPITLLIKNILHSDRFQSMFSLFVLFHTLFYKSMLHMFHDYGPLSNLRVFLQIAS